METGIQTQKNSHFTVYYERVCELSQSTDLLLEQVEKNLQVLALKYVIFKKDETLFDLKVSHKVYYLSDEPIHCDLTIKGDRMMPTPLSPLFDLHTYGIPPFQNRGKLRSFSKQLHAYVPKQI